MLYYYVVIDIVVQSWAFITKVLMDIQNLLRAEKDGPRDKFAPQKSINRSKHTLLLYWRTAYHQGALNARIFRLFPKTSDKFPCHAATEPLSSVSFSTPVHVRTPVEKHGPTHIHAHVGVRTGRAVRAGSGLVGSR